MIILVIAISVLLFPYYSKAFFKIAETIIIGPFELYSRVCAYLIKEVLRRI
jgi:hypothetical protein